MKDSSLCINGNKTYLVKVFLFFLCLLVMNMFSPTIFCQEHNAVLEESVNDLSIVAGSGVAGVVIGLSTLSFAENPGDHLNNILVGGSIGIILGVGLVAWMQASKPYNADLISNKPSDAHYSKNVPLAYSKKNIWPTKLTQVRRRKKIPPSFLLNFQF